MSFCVLKFHAALAGCAIIDFVASLVEELEGGLAVGVDDEEIGLGDDVHTKKDGIFNILRTRLSLLGPEEIKRMARTNRLMGQTCCMSEVEVADVPVLESFLSFILCHNVMSFVITGAKITIFSQT